VSAVNPSGRERPPAHVNAQKARVNAGTTGVLPRPPVPIELAFEIAWVSCPRDFLFLWKCSTWNISRKLFYNYGVTKNVSAGDATDFRGHGLARFPKWEWKLLQRETPGPGWE
jgi:hypothetical protein